VDLKTKPFLAVLFGIIVIAVLVFWVTLDKRGFDDVVSNKVDVGEEAGDIAYGVEAIVSSQRLATEAGFEILSLGGTAADAAVATAAVLSVVEPWFSSVLGGGTWALYYDSASGRVYSLDGVGPIGSLATVADYQARASTPGIHQANVPGSWDAWMLLLENYGKLDLGQILTPAIRLAEEGYPVSQGMSNWLISLSDRVLDRPDTAAIYAPQGRLLQVGETVYQANMAKTFAALVIAYDSQKNSGRSAALQAARDYYYRGPLAQAIVDFSDSFGGYLILDDFNEFEAQIMEPISIQYNEEITVFENPPNSQGIVMLLALNILKGFDFTELGSNDSEVIHRQAEAIKLAFADRHYYIGDPQRVEISIEELLSEEYAQDQRVRIDMDQAEQWPISPGLEENFSADHTTTFHIIDREGNAAAVTTSLGAEFLVIGDTGIHINNRMRMVSLEENNPNQLTPGYKVRHTSNPYMALRGGRPYILGGNTGVDTQPQCQLQQFMSVVEFGLSAQEAIDKPRFVSTAFPAGSYPYGVGNTLQMENGFPSETIQELEAKGHDVVVGSGIFGSANMLVVDMETQEAQIGADSRDDSYGRVTKSAN
jgi:gamma-glutamyltranspeptidase / glutathione hydrolase